MFISLATAGYIQQAPVAELKEGSDIPTLVPVATIVPDLDTRMLQQVMNAGNFNDVKDSKSNVIKCDHVIVKILNQLLLVIWFQNLFFDSL